MVRESARTTTHARPGLAKSPRESVITSYSIHYTKLYDGTTGVSLTDMVVDSAITIHIKPEPGVEYTTEFIGTRVGYDTTRILSPLPGAPTTFRYSEEIGTIMATVTGTMPRYRIHGDEMYVRAKVISTKPKVNPYRDGEVEVAWTQPVLVKRP